MLFDTSMSLATLHAPSLRKRVHEQERTIEELRAELAEQKTQLEMARWEKQGLLAEISRLKRDYFGPRSEKMDPQQCQLALDCALADIDVEEAEQVLPVAPVEPRRQSRRRLPRELPVKITIIDLPEDQKAGLVKIREEVTEQIERQPAQHFIHRIVRYVYAHPHKAHAPVVAPLPAQVLPQSTLGTSVIAHAVVDKYVDHLPLYRQAQIAERAGVTLEPQKLARGVEAAAHLLITVRDQLADRIRESGYVQADETPVNVLDDARPGRARPAWLWAYHGHTARATVFDFNRSRGRDSPASFFPAGWTGVLQTDGWETYASLIKDRPGVTHLACWAHARRYVRRAVEVGDTSEGVIALLADVQRLYQVEREAKDRGLNHAERGELRDSRCPMILHRLHQRLRQESLTALPKSELGKACTYALGRWTELTRYAQPGRGHVEIDNNWVENGIRPTALGRKNWLFVGHPDAGWIAGVIYSVVGTCKLLRLDPEAYLNWVLPQLAAATNHTAAGLLPHDYAATVKEQRP